MGLPTAWVSKGRSPGRATDGTIQKKAQEKDKQSQPSSRNAPREAEGHQGEPRHTVLEKEKQNLARPRAKASQHDNSHCIICRSCRQQESSSNGEACVACAVDGQNQCIKILQLSHTTSQLKGKIQRKFLVRDFSDINLQGHGSPGHGSQWACPQGISLQRHASSNGMSL